MIKILKGDTSADISFALAEGFDYSGATVHVEYQGAVKTFTGCAAGDVLALRFSADETAVMSLGSYPVSVRITNPSGLVKTIQNSNTKICVTDDPAEVSGGAIALDVKGTLYGIEDLPERWTEADIVAKLREIMRRGGAVLCALLTLSAFGASVQTARKDAIHNDELIVTNVIFDAAPDFTTGNTQLVATIEATAPAPGNYAAVSNAAMNAVQSLAAATNYTDVVSNALVHALTTGNVEEYQIKVYYAANADYATQADSATSAASANDAHDAEYAENLGNSSDTHRSAESVFAQLDAATETNALQSAAIANIPDAMTNIAVAVAAEATEGMLTDESDPVWAAQKSQYATTQSVATVSANVGTLWSYVYGNSVWIAVTNYMRTVEGVSPSLQLWEVRDGVTNLVYWSKEEITNVTADLIHDCKTNLEQTVANATNAMPDKSWAKYQSATGAENPQPGDVTIVSTPSVMLTGGGEWTQYVDVGGSQVFLLQSNGLTSFGADTNGYFRVVDSDGNAQFEVKKTDSYFVDAVPSSVHFDEDHNFVATFAANTQPQLYTSENVAAAEYAAEGGDPNISVTWSSPSNGFWSATMEQTVAKPKLFCYAKVLQEGENTIVNTIPARFDGGIRIGNQTYNIGTATISGKTVLTLEAQ